MEMDELLKACYYAVREDHNCYRYPNYHEKRFDKLIRKAIEWLDAQPHNAPLPIGYIEWLGLDSAARRRGLRGRVRSGRCKNRRAGTRRRVGPRWN